MARADELERARLAEARLLAAVLRGTGIGERVGRLPRLGGDRHGSGETDLYPPWTTDPAAVVVAILVSMSPGHPAAMPAVTELPRPSLAALHQQESILLVPADCVDEVEPALVELFPRHTIVMGLPVPVTRARQSLEWCRRALAPAGDSVRSSDDATAQGDVIRCADMVARLLIGADTVLIRRVAGELLAPFDQMTEYRRTILLETLSAWCRRPHVGVPAIARELGKHPQTVRYRLGQLRILLGDALDDDRQLLLMRLVFALHPGPPTRDFVTSSTKSTSTSRGNDR